MFELKRREVEVEGKRFKLRELTLGESADIMNRAMKVLVDEHGRITPVFDNLEFRLTILEYCIEDPKFSREDKEKLPSRVAFTLLDECLKLTPALMSVRGMV